MEIRTSGLKMRSKNSISKSVNPPAASEASPHRERSEPPIERSESGGVRLPPAASEASPQDRPLSIRRDGRELKNKSCKGRSDFPACQENLGRTSGASEPTESDSTYYSDAYAPSAHSSWIQSSDSEDYAPAKSKTEIPVIERWGSAIPCDEHDPEMVYECKKYTPPVESKPISNVRQPDKGENEVPVHQLASTDFDFHAISKKSLEQTYLKIHNAILNTQIGIFLASGEYPPEFPKEIFDLSRRREMLEEKAEQKINGKIMPRNIVAFWITLNPPFEERTTEQVIDQLEMEIDKIKSIWIAHKEWIFENRADIPEQIGRGVHAHILAYTVTRDPLDQSVTHRFSTFCRDFPKSIKRNTKGQTHIMPCDAKSVIPRQKYLRGQKARSKLDRVKLDQVFRKEFGLQEFYTDKVEKNSKN